MILAIVLIAVGGALLLTGELLGVASKKSGDTITEWFVWLRNKTRWVAFVGFLAFVGWLIYHFAVS